MKDRTTVNMTHGQMWNWLFGTVVDLLSIQSQETYMADTRSQAPRYSNHVAMGKNIRVALEQTQGLLSLTRAANHLPMGSPPEDMNTTSLFP